MDSHTGADRMVRGSTILGVDPPTNLFGNNSVFLKLFPKYLSFFFNYLQNIFPDTPSIFSR